VITLPKRQGLKMSLIEERDDRFGNINEEDEEEE